MKTAVIDLQMHWGDPRYFHLRMAYRGCLINQRFGSHRSELARHVSALVDFAKSEGFTHYKLTGHVPIEQAGVRKIPGNVNLNPIEITCPH